ncbi:hypothetical protein BDP67DRAFT_496093 [Colletotrichum lupini]|nr:hypothetical protein BDP67DRAFT_496093 [Colletotrichum lupini]
MDAVLDSSDLILVAGLSRYDRCVYFLILINASSIFASNIPIAKYSHDAVVSDPPRLPFPDNDPKATLNVEMREAPPKLIPTMAIPAAKRLYTRPYGGSRVLALAGDHRHHRAVRSCIPKEEGPPPGGVLMQAREGIRGGVTAIDRRDIVEFRLSGR